MGSVALIALAIALIRIADVQSATTDEIETLAVLLNACNQDLGVINATTSCMLNSRPPEFRLLDFRQEVVNCYKSYDCAIPDDPHNTLQCFNFFYKTIYGTPNAADAILDTCVALKLQPPPDYSNPSNLDINQVEFGLMKFVLSAIMAGSTMNDQFDLIEWNSDHSWVNDISQLQDQAYISKSCVASSSKIDSVNQCINTIKAKIQPSYNALCTNAAMCVSKLSTGCKSLFYFLEQIICQCEQDFLSSSDGQSLLESSMIEACNGVNGKEVRLNFNATMACSNRWKGACNGVAGFESWWINGI